MASESSPYRLPPVSPPPIPPHEERLIYAPSKKDPTVLEIVGGGSGAPEIAHVGNNGEVTDIRQAYQMLLNQPNGRTSALSFWLKNFGNFPLRLPWRKHLLESAAKQLGVSEEEVLKVDAIVANRLARRAGQTRREMIVMNAAEGTMAKDMGAESTTLVPILGSCLLEKRHCEEGRRKKRNRDPNKETDTIVTIHHLAMINQAREVWVEILTNPDIPVVSEKETETEGRPALHLEHIKDRRILAFEAALAFLATSPLPNPNETGKEKKARNAAIAFMEAAEREDLRRAAAWGLITPAVSHLAEGNKGLRAQLEEPIRAVLTTRQNLAGLLAIAKGIPTIGNRALSGASDIDELAKMALEHRATNQEISPSEIRALPKALAHGYFQNLA